MTCPPTRPWTRAWTCPSLAIRATLLAASLAGAAGAQAPAAPAVPAARGFFASEAPLQVTLTANLRQLRRDDGEDPPWRAATLAYTGPDGAAVTIPARVRTRGNWRLKNCSFPPLRLNLGRPARGTMFDQLDKPKLVNYCRDDDAAEQYVLQEYQLYRVYNALTPLSHRARLVRVTYVDSASGKAETTRHAFLLEEDDSLAARAGGTIVEQEGATAEHLDPQGMVLFSLFQYLIGNTDWSINRLHNALLLGAGMSYVPVAYDFDHAGAVNARYARPNEMLPIRRVRDRLYRGYCAPPEAYPPAFALFEERHDAIYALYADSIGRLLDPAVAAHTLEYYDAFYETIRDARMARRLIIDACLE